LLFVSSSCGHEWVAKTLSSWSLISRSIIVSPTSHPMPSRRRRFPWHLAHLARHDLARAHGGRRLSHQSRSRPNAGQSDDSPINQSIPARTSESRQPRRSPARTDQPKFINQSSTNDTHRITFASIHKSTAAAAAASPLLPSSTPVYTSINHAEFQLGWVLAHLFHGTTRMGAKNTQIFIQPMAPGSCTSTTIEKQGPAPASESNRRLQRRRPDHNNCTVPGHQLPHQLQPNHRDKCL
jgi:hypothetical protein